MLGAGNRRARKGLVHFAVRGAQWIRLAEFSLRIGSVGQGVRVEKGCLMGVVAITGGQRTLA